MSKEKSKTNGKSKATKETKEVKKSKKTSATKSTAEPSDATQELLATAKKYGCDYEQNGGTIRVRRKGIALLRITGITKEIGDGKMPNVELKPKLRTRVKDGAHPDAKSFTAATGLVGTKNFEATFNGSNYLYTGKPEKLLGTFSKYFKHVKTQGVN